MHGETETEGEREREREHRVHVSWQRFLIDRETLSRIEEGKGKNKKRERERERKEKRNRKSDACDMSEGPRRR